MSNSTISPNMNLVIPTVGQEAGPQYATDVNASLTIIDQHNHSNGSGVQITPSGIDINSALTLNGNFITNAAGITFLTQGSTPANRTIYSTGNDLYFVDALGNNIQITQSGGIAGNPGSISNLTSPASASYVAVASTFVWQSGVNIAANMDFGSAVLRNITPNSTFALTLSPPAALANDFTITLPTLPASQSIMTIDSSGNIAAPAVYPLPTAAIAAQAITAAKIANATITTAQISASAGILASQLAIANLSAGVYTPSISNTGNITAITPQPFQWLRVGNTVTCSGNMAIQPTAGGSLSFTTTLPVVSNNFTAVTQAGGHAIGGLDVSGVIGYVNANIAAGTASFVGGSASNGNQTVSFHFTYQVI